MSAPPAAPSIFHIVHYDKLRSIIADGLLLSDARIRTRTIAGTTIGMGDIKSARLAQPLSCHPGCFVGEFVPFYLCPRSIMLYVIYRANHPHLAYRGGQDPIVHLEADLHEAVKWAVRRQRRWGFTTSNARARYTQSYKTIPELAHIDWAAVEARNWTAPEIREAKQAEFLVHNSYPWNLIRRIGVRTMGVYSLVQDILKDAGHKPKIDIKPDWYY